MANWSASFFQIAHHFCQLNSSNQFEGFPSREFGCFLCERARGDDNSSSCIFCGDYSIKLSYDFHADLFLSPVLALDKYLLAIFFQYKIDTTISAAPARLFYSIAFPPVRFTNKFLKFLPAN